MPRVGSNLLSDLSCHELRIKCRSTLTTNADCQPIPSERERRRLLMKSVISGFPKYAQSEPEHATILYRRVWDSLQSLRSVNLSIMRYCNLHASALSSIQCGCQRLIPQGLDAVLSKCLARSSLPIGQGTPHGRPVAPSLRPAEPGGV